jgi:arabinofuranosyltransferase
MTADRTTRVLLGVFSVGLVAFASILLRNAWVVDDAYITFRTVDNFVNGYGLRWNVAERVQVYTHPLWMLLVSLFYFVTHEAFYTSIVLSAVLTLAAVLVASWSITRGFRQDVWKAPLLLLALLSCKAFVDYASSGLESPLSYLLVAIFLSDAHSESGASTSAVGVLLLLTSLAFVNHPDLVLLFLPAALGTMIARRRRSWWESVRLIAVTTLPATLWVSFSLFYYGFPLPNTAYAKALCTGFPFLWKVDRGLGYLGNSIRWDGASYLMLVAALFLSAKKARKRALLLILGVLLHMVFVVLSGAASTHMSGRFFAVSLFTAIILFVDGLGRRRVAIPAAALLAVFIAASPVSAIKFGTSAYKRVSYNGSYIDTKWFADQEGIALINWRPERPLPDHEWYRAGEEARHLPDRVHVGGAPGSDAIGFFGFAAGPDLFIVDRLGLSDPLLARLPAIRPGAATFWKSGHFPRAIPDGYVESVELGTNVIRDPNLRRYYAAIQRITRGPLVSWARFKDIWNLNVGGRE